jgi:hypothetical protein
MPIAHLTKVFHVPAVLAFSWACAGQHHLALLFLVFSVMQSCWCAPNLLDGYAMQWRMVTTVVETSGQMEAHLFPFG